MYIKTIVTGSNFLCGSTKGTITQMVKSCWYGKCLVYVLISKLKSTDFLVHVLVSNTPASIGQGALLRQFINFRHDKLICGHCQFSVLWAEDLKKKERCQEIKLHRHNTVISATTVLLYCCLKMREAENESRGEKKEKWGIFTRIKDRLSSTPNKSEINNAVAECITLHRCRTPKGPRAERLFRGSSAKMGYIWQLNQGREKEKERDRIRESGKKGKHCQMNDIRLPFIPALLPLTL